MVKQDNFILDLPTKTLKLYFIEEDLEVEPFAWTLKTLLRQIYAYISQCNDRFLSIKLTEYASELMLMATIYHHCLRKQHTMKTVWHQPPILMYIILPTIYLQYTWLKLK